MRFDRFGAGLVVVVLAAVPARAADDTRTPRARLAEIEAAQKAVSARYSAEFQKAERSKEAQAAAVDRFRGELYKNVEAALELARANPGDPAAFDALKFIIRTNRAGPGDGSAKAMKMILEGKYPRVSDQRGYLPQVALTLRQYPDAEKILRGVLDENPSRANRGDACYWLSHHLHQQARLARMLREKPGDMKDYEDYTAAQPIAQFVSEKDPDVLDKASEALLERVVAEFGDVTRDDDPRTLGVIASGELFARRELRVGKPAPEIEATDHEGKRFKLSDYHGKVVALSFSGNWCGPCRAMYPQDRDLVANLKDKPFALVSVNTDKDVHTLKESISSGEITWRCWFDGGTDGPITTRWGVTAFPSIFVLDSAGVIRFKNVRGDELNRAVRALLGEINTPTAGSR
jgi:peroxiredoxin